MVRHWIKKVVLNLQSREPLVLVGLLLLVVGTWGFIALADEVSDGDTVDFDHWAIRQMRTANDSAIPIGPRWMAEVGRDITGLGGIAVLTLCIISTAGFLAICREYRTMAVLMASTSSGIIVSLLLKSVFSRPRPDVVSHLSDVYTSSFPSGHSMMSAVVYLTLAAILAPVLKHFWIRVYVLSCAVSLTGLIGLSRIYMGVHYPTDVLAGWTAGLVWAIACWLVARSLAKKRSETNLAKLPSGERR